MIERKSQRGLSRVEVPLREVKFDDQAENVMEFVGYGAVFGNIDSYGDAIAKGAFRRTIREAKSSGVWPAMLQQHGGYGMSSDDLMPIGVWTEMSEDDTGLLLRGVLADTQRGQDMRTLMRMQPRPAISGLSIGYIAVKWNNSTKEGEPRRTLTEVKLVEVSPVTFPANPKARITSAKAVGIRRAEQALRDAGFSAAEAKRICAQGFQAAVKGPRDASTELGEIAALLQRNATILKA